LKLPNWLVKVLGIDVGAGTKLSPRSARGAFRKNFHAGADCILNCDASFDRPHAIISIGDRSYIGKSHLVAAEKISIGNDVIISWGVTIVDHNSHATAWDDRRQDILDWHLGKKNWQDVKISPVLISDRVWIGFNATILKGVKLGEGCVVGACSVVTKDVPPYAVVAGNPAKIIRQLPTPLS
jgi:acetyltransferase-like isoleucine patch superfamily enzyme